MPESEFPYSVKPDETPISFHMNVEDQIAKYKDDEKHQKAPLTLPFDLEPVEKDLRAIFERLANIRNALIQAVQQPVEGDPTQLPFNQEYGKINKGAVLKITKKIDAINRLVVDIPDDLAKIAI